MVKLYASIVLYHNNKKQLEKAINSFLNPELHVKLYLIDNSSKDELKELAKLDERIEYIFNNANLGYGTAHNKAMGKSIEDGVTYHLVLNPDIYFENGTLEELFDDLDKLSEKIELLLHDERGSLRTASLAYIRYYQQLADHSIIKLAELA